MKYIHIMTIAGSDCSGGAGIQADIKTISALGAYASSVITAITVQNTCGVSAVYPVPADIVGQQIHAIRTDILPDAIKIGMVTDENIISSICKELKEITDIPVVFDPVLVSSSGFSLATPEALESIKTEMIPLCYLLTPNLPEAQLLSGITIDDETSVRSAAEVLLNMGCKHVLIKGGHRSDGEMKDLLFSKDTVNNPLSFSEQKIHTRNTHGTGCTLSSAIATFIARGCMLPEAVSEGKKYLTKALTAGKDIRIGQGQGPLNHFFDPQKAILK